ncbi:uncharacterized protein LOC134808496 [Pan troglodytes]|uniref:uncharacterized protein LOC134808496 n=1 Tax=Pan troglodytes TaxID=9598 RepID=UPI0030139C9D
MRCCFSELLSNLYSRGNEQTLLEESAEKADQGVHLLRAAVQPVLKWEGADTPGGVGRAGRPSSLSSQSCCPTCTRVGTRRDSWRSRQSRHSGEMRCCFSELLSNLYSRGNEKTLVEESAELADQGVHLLRAAVQPILASRQSRHSVAKRCCFSELLSNLYSRGNEKTLLEELAEQEDQGVHLLVAAVQPVLAREPEDTRGGVGRAGTASRRDAASQSCCPTCTRVGTRRHSWRSRQSRHSGAMRCCFSELLSNLYSRGNEKTLLEELAEQADQGVHLLRAAVQPALAWEPEDARGGVGGAGTASRRDAPSQSCCPTCTRVGTSRHSWRCRQSRQTKEFIFSELLSNLHSRGNEKTLLEELAEQADQGVHLLGAAVQPVLAWERADTPGGVGRAGRPRSSSSQSCCPTCTRGGTRKHSWRSWQSRHSVATRCCYSELLSNLYSRGNGKTLLEESAEQADEGVHLRGAAVQPVLAWEPEDTRGGVGRAGTASR